MKLGCHRILLALVAFAAVPGLARAADHNPELNPEFDVFIKLSEQVRLFLLGDITDGLSPGYTDGEIGAHVDFTLKPIFRRALRDGNWERDRYLWARVGYTVSGDLNDWDGGSITQTILLETTARLELPGQIWLVNRGRVDFRDIGGEFSQRYRLRVGIERAFTVCGVVMVPYVEAETFYDTRYDVWNRQLYQAGVESELT